MKKAELCPKAIEAYAGESFQMQIFFYDIPPHEPRLQASSS